MNGGPRRTDKTVYSTVSDMIHSLWFGKVRPGMARQGKVWHGRLGKARQGPVRLGRHFHQEHQHEG